MFYIGLFFYLYHIIDVTGRPATDTNTTTKGKPWLSRKRFQGDIDGHNQVSFDALVNDLNRWQDHRLQRRNGSTGVSESAISDPRGLWLNGRVPYVFASSDPRLKQAVQDAFKDFHTSTCIRFIERTDEVHYLSIGDKEDGCHSQLGNVHKGGQLVNLADECKVKGTAIHELMHAIGFWHEHQRIDRDNYVVVTFENIEPDQRDQYFKANTSQMNLIGKYDMSSVMHYPADGFALPGKLTMKAKDSNRIDFGGEVLTDEDKRKIRQLYRCDAGPKGDTLIAPDAIYFIKPEGTDNCLDVPGSSTQNGVNLQQWDCNGSPAQQWMFTKLADNVYSVKNVGNGKYVDVADEEANQDGGKVQQFEAHDGGPPAWQHQQFKIEPREGGVFHIVSVLNGRIIWPDVKGQIHHWKFDSGQNWKLERMRLDANITADVPYFIIEPGTKKCWDVPHSSKVNGVNLIAADCNRSDTQQWIFRPVNDSVYTIENVGSGKYVEVASEEMNNDYGKIQQTDGNDKGPSARGQQFNIVPRNGAFHITSVANGRIIWTATNSFIHHWKFDAGQNWKLEPV